MKRSITMAVLTALGSSPFAMQAASAAEVEVQAGPAHVQVTTPGAARAYDPANSQAGYADEATRSNTVLRASTLMGHTVINTEGETVGSIEDVVLDAKTGKISYAAVSMGGFLGVGDKLFAVPWQSIRCDVRDGEHVCVLPVSKERLEGAEGFDQDNWPNMADKQWQQRNDRAYGDLLRRTN